jgi:predicted transcriptional regulator YdeE
MQDFELKQLSSFKLIGVELRTTNANGQAMQEIPLFWERLIRNKTFAQIPGQVEPNLIYAAYVDYDDDFKVGGFQKGFYTLIVGSKVASLEEVPQGFVAREFPAEKHAVLQMKGQAAKVVPEAWKRVWSSSFPFKRKLSCDLEVYNMDALVDAEREISLWVSVV